MLSDKLAWSLAKKEQKESHLHLQMLSNKLLVLAKKSKKRLELEKGKPFNEKDLKIKSAELSMHFSPVLYII